MFTLEFVIYFEVFEQEEYAGPSPQYTGLFLNRSQDVLKRAKKRLRCSGSFVKKNLILRNLFF